MLIFAFFRPKHPVKVHVWAGISKQGATGICIFQVTLVKELFVDILDKTFLPFIKDIIPQHRFMQDNDPKYTSGYAKDWIEEKEINCWKTPPESPDLNPTENLWHELKEYIRRVVKPKSKEELVEGIKEFWRTVNVQKCNKYIGHLRKVIPKVIEVGGNATGY